MSILPLPSLPTDKEFMHHNPAEFQKSWDWLTAQYEQEKNSLEQYEERAGANMQYVLKRKSFLLALHRHLQAVRKENIYLQIHLNMEHITTAKLRDHVKYLSELLALHGVEPHFMKPFAKQYAHQLFELAKLTGSVRLPDAFIKHGNFPKSPFNLYAK